MHGRRMPDDVPKHHPEHFFKWHVLAVGDLAALFRVFKAPRREPLDIRPNGCPRVFYTRFWR